ncbi:MAG TPA: ABC transporter ATP-binding protein [Anaerolineae bacterium]|nr:ABC transporter ATP-binding protein [Anaerolineae bacterium]HQK14462.1 ABC transporter ATP-binding protein [Anaerolineae bacterium]
MADNNNTLIQVKDLKVHFFTNEGIVRAVDGVTFDIHSGKTLCMVGESGCGKSVTARALLQIVHRPGKIVNGDILMYRKKGRDQIEEINISKLEPKGRTIRSIRGKEISMIFQEPMTSLSPMYTVGNQIMETIMLHTKADKKQARERTLEMLEFVGIPHPNRIIDEYPFRLSGGMRQRAMIAMALSCNPSLLIADEPTTALDVTTQAQIIDLMLGLQRDYDMGIMFITHDLGVVAEIADNVAVMYLGNVVEYSDVYTIFNDPQHPYTQSLLRSIPKVTATREKLEVIRGMVPSPFRRPSGCPFHPRCPKAMPICSQVEPRTINISENHQVHCLLFDEDAKKPVREMAS